MAGWTLQDLQSYRKTRNPGQTGQVNVNSASNSSGSGWTMDDLNSYRKSQDPQPIEKPKLITPTHTSSSIPSTNEQAAIQPVQPVVPTGRIMSEKEFYNELPWYRKIGYTASKIGSAAAKGTKEFMAGAGDAISKPFVRLSEKVMFGNDVPQGWSRATDIENYYKTPEAFSSFVTSLGDSARTMSEKDIEKAFEKQKKAHVAMADKEDTDQMMKSIIGQNPQADLSQTDRNIIGAGEITGQLAEMAILTELGVPPIATGAVTGGASAYGNRGDLGDVTRGAAAGGIFMGVAAPVSKVIGGKGLEILSRNPALKNSIIADFTNHFASSYAGYVAGDQAANLVRNQDEDSKLTDSMKHGLIWGLIGAIPGTISDVRAAKNVFQDGGKAYFNNIGRAYEYAKSNPDPAVRAETLGKIANSLDDSIKDLSPEGRLRFVGQQKKINQAVNMMEIIKSNILGEKAAAENMMNKTPGLSENNIATSQNPGANFNQMLPGNIVSPQDNVSAARQAIANFGGASEAIKTPSENPAANPVAKGQKVSIPMDNRTMDNVGNRKVAAFQFDHPEIKSYIQEEASYILYDLNNSIQGERTATTDVDGTMRWHGTDRMTTKSLAAIKDSTGATWNEMRKALEDIMKDGGKENNALAKKIELYIDDHLINGTTRIDGTKQSPNAEYIAKRNEINQQLGIKPIEMATQSGWTDEYIADLMKGESNRFAQPAASNMNGGIANEGSQAAEGKNIQRADNGKWKADDLEQQRVKEQDRKIAEGILQSGITILKEYGAENVKAELVSPKTMAEKQLQEIMKPLGVKAFYFKSENGKFATDDLVDSGFDDIMLIEQADSNDMAWNVGHAFGHILQTRHPDLYKEMLDFIEKTTSIEDKMKYLDTFSKTPLYQEIMANNPDRLYTEMLNDEIGNNFVDKSFWEKLFDYSKDLFNKIKKIVLDLVNKIAGRKYENYFTNEQAKTIQEKLIKVMDEVGKREAAKAEGEAAATKEVSMSAREKESKIYGKRPEWQGATKSDNNSPLLDKYNYYEDESSESWLKGVIKNAKERTAEEEYPYIGKVTGGYHKNFMLDPKWVLENTAGGLRNEHIKIPAKLKANDEFETKRMNKLIESMKVEGYNDIKDPIFVNITFDGKAWINEGNHRLRAAVEAGLKEVPVEVRYFDGGERHNTPWKPDNLVELVDKTSTSDEIKTPAFKKWFGSSKVVDEKGNPMIVYHGTPDGKFNEFNKFPAYFSANKEIADIYQAPAASSIKAGKKVGTPETKAVYLKIENPFDTRIPAIKKIFDTEYNGKGGEEWTSNGTPLQKSGLPDWTDGEDLYNFIKEKGYDYDGIILDEGGLGGYGDEVKSRGISYVAFKPEQIKSATDNNGDFNAANPDIRYSAREKKAKEEKNLLAVRNTKEADLFGVLELGGMPVPSIAITKDNIPFTNFGDITVVFDKGAIDPKNAANKVFDADIYSARFPEVKREVNRENSKKMIAALKQGIDEKYYKELDNLQYNIWENDRPVDFYARYNDAVAAAYLKDQGKEINEDTLREARRSSDIANWLADKAEEYNVYGEKRIRNNKDVFTYSGDRRSFKQLYDEYTLDNLVRLMKGQTKDTEGFFYGVGNIRGSIAKKYSNLSAIKKDRSRIVSKEEIEPIKKKFDDQLSELMAEIEPFYKHKTGKYDFGLMDNIGQTIAIIAKKPLSPSMIQREFAESQFNPLSDEVVQKIIGFLEELKSAPTEYFEAKPQRVVGLHEIRYVVMPDNTSDKMKKALKEANIPTLEYKAGDDQDRVKTIKSIVDDNVKFSAREKKEKPVKPFFSKLQKTLEEKMPAAAFTNDIRNLIKANGIKEEEIKWSGIDDLLTANAGKKLSKQEVLDYVAANDLQIDEVTKGGETKDINSFKNKGWYKWFKEKDLLDQVEFEFMEADPFADGYSQYDIMEAADTFENDYDMPQDLAREAARDLMRANESPTKFGNYVLSGGKNYKELLFTLPEAKADIPDQLKAEEETIRKDLEALNDKYDTLHEKSRKMVNDMPIDQILHGGKNFKEYEATLAEMTALSNQRNTLEGDLRKVIHEISELEENAAKKDYRSPHWDEKNVLAHTRIDDRTDAEGNKILFVEEIQSDLHQSGRQRGYKSDAEKALSDAGISFYQEQPGVSFGYFVNSEGAALVSPDAFRGNSTHKTAVNPTPEQKEIMDKYRASVLSGKALPDAPFKKTWHEFVIKRLIRYAAENGYDKIAWTTGEQQAARYDLSKQVEKITYNRNPQPAEEGKIYVAVFTHENNPPVISGNMTPLEIENTVGKEIAQKIVNGGSYGKLTGLDLKVGGEGMKGFYDKIVPDFVSKYIKKWGGKIENIKISQGLQFDNRVYEGKEYTYDEIENKVKEFTVDHQQNAYIQQLIAIGKAMQNGETFKEAIEGRGSVGLAEKLGGSLITRQNERSSTQMAFSITPEMKDSVLYEGQSLFSMRDKEYKDLNDMEKDIDGMISEAMKNKKKAKEANVNYDGFTDAETEARWQKAKDFTPSYMEKIKTSLEEFMHDMKIYTTRGALPFLERGGKYADLRFKLQNFKKMRAVVSDRTLRNLDGIVSILDKDPQLYDIFSRKVALDDMSEELKANHDLGFGFTRPMLREELEKVDQAISQDERLNIALDFRKKLWQLIKKEYIKIMKDIDFDVGDRFSKDNYFRHIIIENLQKNNLTTGSIKLKTPSNAGYLKKREGSLKDYVSDYLQAEAEVMANMLYDIEKARIIKYIKNSEHNIKKMTKQLAKDHNKRALEDLIDKDKNMNYPFTNEKGEPISPTEEEIKGFNQRIAIGFEGLKNLAELDLLWTGENGEYKDVVDNLVEGKKTATSGSGEDIDSNKTFKYLSELIAREEQGAMNAATILKYVSRKRSFTKQALGDSFKTWRDMIPEGHIIWQPREGTHFFMAYSVPERIAEKLLEGLMPEAIMTKEKLRGVLTRGMPYEEYVIPEEVAMTFEKLIDIREEIVPEKILRRLTGAWKQYQLIAPTRMIKYNIRNVTGDIDHVNAANPKIMLRSKAAAQELWNTMILGKPMSEDLRGFFERGGFATNLQAAEMGDIPKLKNFVKLYGGKAGSITSIPQKVWTKYWEGARQVTDFRETILRYAAYLHYLEEIETNNGNPTSLHASIPEEIAAIRDYKDKAFQLSNDLLGAYDDVSVVGQKLRKDAFPFWSWIEVNPKVYYRLMKNAIRNDEFTYEVGSRFAKIIGKKVGMFTAIKIGQLILGAMFLNALMAAWNLIFFKDEEDKLPEGVREKSHIILGHSGDDILYFNRLGAVSDVFDWGGLDTIFSDVKDIMAGKMTLKEKAIQMIESPANKLAAAAYPFHKTLYELITGKTTYPNIFEAQTIRDRGIYLARSFGLENEYRALTGKPLKGGSYVNNLKNLWLYSTDPQEAAYWDIYDKKNKFLEKIGKPAGGGSYQTPKSDALYNFKVALRYGDQKAADKYLAEYFINGGTQQGLKSSIKNMSPLSGMNNAMIGDFVNGLTEKDKEKLDMAFQFYYEALGGELDSNSSDEQQPQE